MRNKSLGYGFAAAVMMLIFMLQTSVFALSTQTITASNISVNISASKSIGATALGNATLSYSSSDTSIATVSSTGVVKGKKAGTATITITAAKTAKYKAATKTIAVTVKRLTQTITASNISVNISASKSIGATALGDATLSYSSSDTSIATVSSTGVVKGKKAGTATITIKAAQTAKYKSSTKTIAVTVKRLSQTVTASDISVTIDSTKSIGATALGDAALSYSSSDTSVATVSSTGVVKGIKAGTATVKIKAAQTAKYKSATKTITVTVNKRSQTISIDSGEKSMTFDHPTAAKKTVTFKSYKTSLSYTVSGNAATVTYNSAKNGIIIKPVKAGSISVKVKAAADDKYKVSNTITIKAVVNELRVTEVSVRTIAPKMPENVLSAFETLDWQIKIDPTVSYSGRSIAKCFWIILRENDPESDTIYHELGHFVAFVAGNVDATTAFSDIYTEEKNKFPGVNKIYASQNPSEYFGECMREYISRPAQLKNACPKSYAAVESAIAKITTAQVSLIRRAFSASFIENNRLTTSYY